MASSLSGLDASVSACASRPVSAVPARGRIVASDKFVVAGETGYAGLHLIADFWGACSLDDIEALERAMRDAVAASGATLLHLHLHPFGEGQGISGVAVLAESHISVHTWPERGYAAFDAFMCGDADVGKALKVLERHLRPSRTEAKTLRRGTFRRAPEKQS